MSVGNIEWFGTAYSGKCNYGRCRFSCGYERGTMIDRFRAAYDRMTRHMWREHRIRWGRHIIF